MSNGTLLVSAFFKHHIPLSFSAINVFINRVADNFKIIILGKINYFINGVVMDNYNESIFSPGFYSRDTSFVNYLPVARTPSSFAGASSEKKRKRLISRPWKFPQKIFLLQANYCNAELEWILRNQNIRL